MDMNVFHQDRLHVRLHQLRVLPLFLSGHFFKIEVIAVQVFIT